MQYRIISLTDHKPSRPALHQAGEQLAREMLSQATGNPPDCFVFEKAQRGKPFVRGCSHQFNISHSGDHVLCAIHAGEIGVDIERIRPVPQKVFKNVCTPAEQQYIGNDPIRFAEIWTRKEAYAKLDGRGLAYGLQNIEVATAAALCPTIYDCSVMTAHIEGYVYSIIWK